MVWVYATAGHAAPTLLDTIATEAAQRVSEFNPQNLANTALAYATAERDAPALLDAIAAEAAPRLSECTQQDICNTAWAFAAANRPMDCSGLFGQRFAGRCEELEEELTIVALWALCTWASAAAPKTCLAMICWSCAAPHLAARTDIRPRRSGALAWRWPRSGCFRRRR